MNVHCPNCGIPTIPDQEWVRYEEALCERCYSAKRGSEGVGIDIVDEILGLI